MSEENNSGKNTKEQNNNCCSPPRKSDSENSDFNNNFYPWIKSNSKCHSLKGILKLHYEILDFYDFIKLTDSEIRLRNKTYNDINSIIEDNFANYKCKLYGSFITELSLPNSDIDTLITQKDENDGCNEKNLHQNLENIYSVLKNQNVFNDLEKINAKVPIITGTFKSTNIHVDISLFKKNGVDAAEIIKKVINIYPEIKPLLLLIKYVIRQRDLNQIYTVKDI